MLEEACEILVVGAGPAGSAAALAAAKEGSDALMVESKPTVGLPVRCAEFIPAMLVGKLGLGKGYVVQSVKGLKTFLKDGPPKVLAAPGYVVRREVFDQALARAAVDAGARLLLSTRAVGRLDDGTVVLRRKDGGESVVRPRIVVGADGPRSTVARWAGAAPSSLLPAVQVTLPLKAPLEYAEAYLDPEFRAGYGWLFPKGSVANAGLGMKKAPENKGRLTALLKRFAARLEALGKVEGEPLKSTAGWVPASPVRPCVHGDVALVGDAAGHAHPVTGAGVLAAVEGGTLAGRWAARAVREKDISLLMKYEAEWMDLFGPTLERARERRRLMESRWEDFHRIIERCWIAYREYYR